MDRTTHGNRGRARHWDDEKRAEADARADAAVKAAYLECVAEGLFPSIDRIARRLKMAGWIVDNARARLIEAGAVPAVDSPYAAWRERDDPFAEQPDDPDADEVQARIEAARATKSSEARPIRVMTARYHRPDSRRRVVA